MQSAKSQKDTGVWGEIGTRGCMKQVTLFSALLMGEVLTSFLPGD